MSRRRCGYPLNRTPRADDGRPCRQVSWLAAHARSPPPSRRSPGSGIRRRRSPLTVAGAATALRREPRTAFPFHPLPPTEAPAGPSRGLERSSARSELSTRCALACAVRACIWRRGHAGGVRPCGSDTIWAGKARPDVLKARARTHHLAARVSRHKRISLLVSLANLSASRARSISACVGGGGVKTGGCATNGDTYLLGVAAANGDIGASLEMRPRIGYSREIAMVSDPQGLTPRLGLVRSFPSSRAGAEPGRGAEGTGPRPRLHAALRTGFRPSPARALRLRAAPE